MDPSRLAVVIDPGGLVCARELANLSAVELGVGGLEVMLDPM